MSFEIRDRDLLGRIGRLFTKSGAVETPAFMPVINPANQILSPKIMYEKFGCRIVITNSYILKKHFDEIPNLDVHDLLDFPGVVTTDSGAYQILVYGDIDVTQEEIIKFQKKIDSDIAVILDIPTGWDVPRIRVEYTVEETLRRAREAIPIIQDSNILWMGPVQGGKHLDLVAHSARETAKMPFQIYALGSPTEVMEQYLYPILVDMIMTAKNNLPISRPFHLFGAGHPMMLSMAVAFGCDLFDSAAYALYAKDNRYLTPRGTLRLENIRYLPCECPVCSNLSADDLKNMIKGERIRLLTEHNLYVTMLEIEKIKQAIAEGTLWDLVETRARGHPALTSALKKFSKYKQKLERHSPGFKGHGVFYYDHNSLNRPELTRYHSRLLENYIKPDETEKMLLLKAPLTTPYRLDSKYIGLKERLKKDLEDIHVCFYATPYGCIPEDLSETYPLSQFEITEQLGHEIIKSTSKLLEEYLRASGHLEIILVMEEGELDVEVENLVRKIHREQLAKIHIIKESDIWSDVTSERISNIIKQNC